MCIVCIEYVKGTITLEESRNAAKELYNANKGYHEEDEHYLDIMAMMNDEELDELMRD